MGSGVSTGEVARMTRSERRRLFWMVTGAALILRTAHILLMRDNPLFDHPAMDAAIYDRWARGLAEGAWPFAAPFCRAPLFPLILGGLYGLFDAARLPVQLALGSISALGAGFSGLAAARIWGRRSGYCAGLLHATLWTSIYFSAELLPAALTATLVAAALWLLLDRDQGVPAGGRRLAAEGGVLGLAAIAKPAVLIVLPALLWHLARRSETRPGRGAWAALALGILLPILPVTAVNVLRGGDAVLIASGGGIDFHIGNNALSDGSSALVPGAGLAGAGGCRDAAGGAEQIVGGESKPSAVDRHYLREGIRFWLREPEAALKLYGRKLRMLLGAGERSRDKFIHPWREWSPLLRLPVWPGWTAMLALAVVGIRRRWTGAETRGLLTGFAGFYALSILLFCVNARMRLPLAAMMTIPAGAGLEALWIAVRRRRLEVPKAALAAAAVLGILSFADLMSFDRHRAQDNPFHHYMLGEARAAAGEAAEAEREYRLALDLRRGHPQARFDAVEEDLYAGLAAALAEQGKSREALEVHQRWVRRLPGTIEGRLGLGAALLAAGRIDDAAAQFEITLRSVPDDPRARLGYAWIQYHNGNLGAALRTFRSLDREKPDHRARFGVGLCLMKQKRFRQAERAFRDALELRPGDPEILERLEDIREKTGRDGESQGR